MVTIERTHDANRISGILLHESMGGAFNRYRGKIGGVVANDDNFCFADDLRTCVFVRVGHPNERKYAIVVAMLPGGREAGSKEFVRACLDVMLATGATVVCQIEAGNKAAIDMAVALDYGVELEQRDGKVHGLLTPEIAAAAKIKGASS